MDRHRSSTRLGTCSGACPDTVTVSPDGAHLYITHYDDNDSVSAIDLTNNGVSTIDLGDQPLRVAP
jgi:YVTN family beta-propeller protein